MTLSAGLSASSQEVAAKIPSAQLSAQILNEVGVPRKGVSIELSEVVSECSDKHTRVHSPIAVDLTDEQGIFVVNAQPNQVARLTLSKEGSRRELLVPLVRSLDLGEVILPSRDSVVAPSDSVGVSNRLKSESRQSTRVGVVDADTRLPIANALVWLEGDPSCWGRTDVDGLSFGAPESSTNILRIAAPGYFGGNAVLGPTLVSVELHPAPLELVGKLEDYEGRGISRGLVEIRRLNRAVRSSSDGVFTISGLAVGHIPSLTASASGFSSRTQRISDPENRLVIVLYRPRVVRGRVVDPAARPVPGAVVRLGFLGSSEMTLETTVGAEGGFSSPPSPIGNHRLEIEANGMAVRTEKIEVPPGRGPFSLGVLTLQPGAEIIGRTVDPDGAPIAEVEVWVRRRPWLAIKGSGRPSGPPSTSTAADGTFHLDGLDPTGKSTLVLRKAGYSPVTAQVLPDSAEESVFELAPAGRLQLRVIDSRREPVVGARIIGLPKGVSGSGPFPTTNEDGEILLENLGEGRYPVSVHGGEVLEVWHGALEIPSAGAKSVREVQLAPARLLAGQFVGPKGEPVAGVQIGLEGQMVGDSSSWEGRFEMGPLAPTTYTFKIEHPVYETMELAVDMATVEGPLTIRLEDRSVLVIGRLEGVRVGQIKLILRQEASGRVFGVSTDAGGNFDFGRLRPGQYRVSVDEGDLKVLQGQELFTVTADVSTYTLIVPVTSLDEMVKQN